MRHLAAILVFALAGVASAQDAPKTAETVPAERPHITLSWSTASEMDNYGFFVMRADEEKGPFKILNEKIIPGGGNSDLPLEYKYTDEAVVPGKTYWYYLESVSTSGVKEKFSPTLQRKCCKVAGAAAKLENATEKPAEKPAEKSAKTPAPKPADKPAPPKG